MLLKEGWQIQSWDGILISYLEIIKVSNDLLQKHEKPGKSEQYQEIILSSWQASHETIPLRK